MSEKIWVSTVKGNTDLEMGFGFHEGDLNDDQIVKWYRDLKAFIEKGVVPPADLLPDRLDSRFGEKHRGYAPPLPAQLPDVVRWEYTLVSEPVADVFRRFDLGDGILHPVVLYRHNRKADQKERIDQRFYLLVPGAAKKTVDIEASPRGARKRYGRLASSNWVDHDDMAVYRDCLQGADFWVDSGLAGGALYFSDALRAALKEAGLHKAFEFKSCRLVG